MVNVAESSHAIGVGIWIDARNPTRWPKPWAQHYRDCLGFAVLADDHGLDLVGCPEHHFFTDGYLPQPLTFAAAVAARTRQVRIVTGVMMPGYRNPVDLAEQVAVVDLLSDGRLDLGFGVGYRLPEFEAFGLETKDRWQRFEDRVDDLREFWASGEVTPLPIQNPVPIYAGVTGPRGLRLAGRLGLRLLNRVDDFDAYLLGLTEGGHEPTLLRQTSLLHAILVDDPDESLAYLDPYIANFWHEYINQDAKGTGKQAALGKITTTELLANGPNVTPGFALLTVDQAAQFVLEFADRRPVERVGFWATIPGVPTEVAHRNIELLADLKRVLAARARPLWQPARDMRSDPANRIEPKVRSIFAR